MSQHIVIKYLILFLYRLLNLKIKKLKIKFTNFLLYFLLLQNQVMQINIQVKRN